MSPAPGPKTDHHVVVSLGANLGDPVEALRSAVRALADDPDSHLVAVSHAYGSAPVGGPEQPDYVNAVVVLTTTRDPHEVLALAHAIEQAHDRIRQERWGPRTLDVDVIAYDDVVDDDPLLTLPHPRAHERAFVLLPWSEVEPEAVVTGRGPVADLLRDVADQQIQRLDEEPTLWSALDPGATT